MGEYAKVKGTGEQVKIGTCEDLYYLRADQRDQISGYDFGAETLAVVRFRFPFPDEDGEQPGGFDDYDRGLRLDGFEQPADVEHGTVQFTASNGYLTSLPCPEGPESAYTLGSCEAGANNGLHKVQIARNGYGGPASLIQQAFRGGRWVGIARCNGCGTRYRLEDGYEELAAVALRSVADGDARWNKGARSSLFHETADRLLAGYVTEREARLARIAAVYPEAAEEARKAGL